MHMPPGKHIMQSRPLLIVLLYIILQNNGFMLPSGEVSITNNLLQFSLQSAPTTDLPVFTLTCNSTGGPATTVTWTLNGTAASGVSSQTVTDHENSVYHNTLTVTGRLLGDYQCTVTNNRTTSPAIASLTVAGE